jgi:hypothetical protein
MFVSAVMVLGFVAIPAAGRAGVTVPTQHNDNFRTGANLSETTLTPDAVRLHGLVGVDRSVDGFINTQLLYAPGVATNAGPRDIVYATTSADSVYAFDAGNRDSAPQGGFLWRWSPPALSSVSPLVLARGINATPVLDVTNGKGTIDVLYSTTNQVISFSVFVADELAMLPTLDVHFYLVKLDLATGIPVQAPVELHGAMLRSDGATVAFDPRTENGVASLLLDHGYLYVSFSARQNENVSQYYGWMLRYRASDLAYAGAFNTEPYAYDWTSSDNPRLHPASGLISCYEPDPAGHLKPWSAAWVKNRGLLTMACVGEGGGIWQGGAGPAADRDGNVYAMIGNGHYDAGTQSYGDSIVKLSAAPAQSAAQTGDFHVAGSYAPTEELIGDELDDVDLGSAGPLVVDGAHRILAGGKTGIFYDVTDGLERVQVIIGATNHHDLDSSFDRYQTWNLGPHLHGSPTYWRTGADGGYIYEWAEKDYLKKYRFDATRGTFVFSDPRHPWLVEGGPLAGACNDLMLCLNAMPGGMLALTADGTKPGTGIVWAILRAHDDTSADAVYAFDADTLQQLWSDDIGTVPHFAGPTVADGRLFVPTNSFRFTIYTLGSGAAAPLQAKRRAPTSPRSAVAAFAPAANRPMRMEMTAVPDYATDPAYVARILLPAALAQLPSGTVIGAAFLVHGVDTYDCPATPALPCRLQRAVVHDVSHYDDRPNRASLDEVKIDAACTVRPGGTSSRSGVSNWGLQWEILTNTCPRVFGNSAVLLRFVPLLRGPNRFASPGPQSVQFTDVFLAAVPGATLPPNQP